MFPEPNGLLNNSIMTLFKMEILLIGILFLTNSRQLSQYRLALKQTPQSGQLDTVYMFNIADIENILMFTYLQITYMG